MTEATKATKAARRWTWQVRLGGRGWWQPCAAATTDHAASSHGLPVIVVRPADLYHGDRAGPDDPRNVLAPGVYGPADLPAGTVIHDGTTNATPEWLGAEDIRQALADAGYAVTERHSLE